MGPGLLRNLGGSSTKSGVASTCEWERECARNRGEEDGETEPMEIEAVEAITRAEMGERGGDGEGEGKGDRVGEQSREGEGEARTEKGRRQHDEEE